MLFTATKKLFSFSRYSNFCFSVFPYFSLSAIAVEDDLIQILKFIMSSIVNIRPLITFCLIPWEGKKFETLLIDRTFFWKNHSENVHEKVVLDFFLILVNIRKKPLHARHYFQNKIFWKRITKKPCNFIFSFEARPF